jgi:transcriptional regulator with XRE-family HTH domain
VADKGGRHARGDQVIDSAAQDPALALMVRRLRRERGMSQEALAFEAKVTVSTLSRIERGLHNPTLRTLWCIAAALGISFEELAATVERHA